MPPGGCDALLPKGQSSPGILQSGQQPSNAIRQIPQLSSLATQRQVATPIHLWTQEWLEVMSHQGWRIWEFGIDASVNFSIAHTLPTPPPPPSWKIAFAHVLIPEVGHLKSYYCLGPGIFALPWNYSEAFGNWLVVFGLAFGCQCKAYPFHLLLIKYGLKII